MVKMTKNSAMIGLLEPIKNSAIWKSVLHEAVLREAKVYNLLMGCSPFTNYRFQMGVTVMGFAEHFWLSVYLGNRP